MAKQLITVGEVGSITSLDFKAKGMDIKKYGHASVDRVTEIIWSRVQQAWYVTFLLGRLRGMVANKSMLGMALGIDIVKVIPEATAKSQLLRDTAIKSNTLYFITYEDAVAFEVAVIQWSRANGKGDFVG